jgi:hypothetical protein
MKFLASRPKDPKPQGASVFSVHEPLLRSSRVLWPPTFFEGPCEQVPKEGGRDHHARFMGSGHTFSRRPAPVVESRSVGKALVKRGGWEQLVVNAKSNTDEKALALWLQKSGALS